METLKIDLAKIKLVAPKAWADFSEFYAHNFPSHASENSLALEKLPFEFMAGLLLRYFYENGVEWDVTNTDFKLLPDTLPDIFEQYEKTLSHYS